MTENQHDEDMPVDVPHPRWSVPELNLPPNATPYELAKALADIVMGVNTNLAYLRADAEARWARETLSEREIRVLKEEIDSLKARVTTLENRLNDSRFGMR